MALYCTYNAKSGRLCVSNLDKPNANNFNAYPATLVEATEVLVSHGYKMDGWEDASNLYKAPIFVTNVTK